MTTLTKVGVIGAAAALVVLAGAAPAMADTDTGTQGVTGTLAATSAVTVPAAASLTLVPGGTATADGDVVVHSNAGYILEVSDANDGELTDTGNSTPTLADPLEVSSTTTTGAGALAAPTSLVDSATVPLQIGSTDSAAASTGDTYDVTLSQPVTWGDAPSTGAGYTDTLTYTVSPQL